MEVRSWRCAVAGLHCSIEWYRGDTHAPFWVSMHGTVLTTQFTPRSSKVDFRWSGDANIVMGIDLPVGGTLTRLAPKVSDLAVSGTARVVLRPLLDTIPGFGAALVSLRKPPIVRWAAYRRGRLCGQGTLLGVETCSFGASDELALERTCQPGFRPVATVHCGSTALSAVLPLTLPPLLYGTTSPT